MIIEIITSELDFYINEKIRELRIKAGLGQVTLSQKLGVAEGYIGSIENPKDDAKANFRMLARIAQALDQESYFKFFPNKIFSNDMVRIRIELFDVSSRNQTLDKNGKVPERLKELERKPISSEEIKELKSKGEYKYCTIIEK